jgi:c-di-GMP-binding flagellar brake protein YcgR
MATILNYHEHIKLLGRAIIDGDKSCLRTNLYILRRKMERFDLELTVYLSVTDREKKQKSFEFMTNNICAGGAFPKTEKPY